MSLILKQIQIKNFLSHKDTVIDFNDDESILIDGNSGSGKSSIVEAVIWCLYGEARVENRNLVKHGEETAMVSVQLKNYGEDQFWTITRSTTNKAKNSLDVTLTLDGQVTPLERNGLRDKQEWIEREFLHASHTLFINSIAYPQDNIDNFVRQSATERKDLLLEIVNINDFDVHYEKAKKKLSAINDEKIKCVANKDSHLSQLDRQFLMMCDEQELETMIAGCDISIDYQKKKLEEISQRKQSFGGNSEDIQDLENTVREGNEKILEISRVMTRKDKEIKDIESINIEAIKEKMAKYDLLQIEWSALSQKIDQDYERTNKLNAVMADRPQDRDYDSEILDINKRLIPLVKETGTCPSGDACPFVAPIKSQINYLSEQINEKIGKKAQLEKDKTAYAEKIALIGPSLLTLEERDRARSLKAELMVSADCKEMLASANAKMAMLPEIKLSFGELNTALDQVITSTKAAESKLIEKKALQNSNKEVLNKLNEEERGINSIISSEAIQRDLLIRKRVMSYEARKYAKELQDQIAGIDVSMGILDHQTEVIMLIKEAFGSKGLKTVVIDYLIPRLEEKINEILSQLSEFRVRLDTQKSTSDGEGVVEGLFINIFNEKGEQFDFASYSGGERLKITVAISEALASLQKCGFRIFDELFIGLDEDSTEHFAKVMDKLQKKFKQVICISHLRSIKDLFNKKIAVSKINGTSRIEE